MSALVLRGVEEVMWRKIVVDGGDGGGNCGWAERRLEKSSLRRPTSRWALFAFFSSLERSNKCSNAQVREVSEMESVCRTAVCYVCCLLALHWKPVSLLLKSQFTCLLLFYSSITVQWPTAGGHRGRSLSLSLSLHLLMQIFYLGWSIFETRREESLDCHAADGRALRQQLPLATSSSEATRPEEGKESILRGWWRETTGLK